MTQKQTARQDTSTLSDIEGNTIQSITVSDSSGIPPPRDCSLCSNSCNWHRNIDCVTTALNITLRQLSTRYSRTCNQTENSRPEPDLRQTSIRLFPSLLSHITVSHSSRILKSLGGLTVISDTWKGGGICKSPSLSSFLPSSFLPSCPLFLNSHLNCLYSFLCHPFIAHPSLGFWKCISWSPPNPLYPTPAENQELS